MGPETVEEKARAAFRARAGGGAPQLVRAPYRVCPLGAHIDHQGGTVLGMAIDRGVVLAWKPRDDGRVRLASLDFPEEAEFDAAAPGPPRGRVFWGDYAAGQAAALAAGGARLARGIDGVMAGEMPIGGLSSSAAAGLCCGVALRRANGIALDPWDLIRSTRRAENDYAGVACGLLDPATIVFAEARRLVRIDCRAQEASLVAPGEGLPPFAVAVAFSGVTRALAGSGYNNRVAECREAARLLARAAGRADGAAVLSDISREEHDAFGAALPDALRRRAAHYFGEAARVEDGIAAWRAGDLARMGALMNASGESSIVNYEAGCPEVIALWEILRARRDVLGARFSGGGFGGAVVALVPAGAADIEEETARAYAARCPQAAAGFRLELRASGPGLRW